MASVSGSTPEQPNFRTYMSSDDNKAAIQQEGRLAKLSYGEGKEAKFTEIPPKMNPLFRLMNTPQAQAFKLLKDRDKIIAFQAKQEHLQKESPKTSTEKLSPKTVEHPALDQKAPLFSAQKALTTQSTDQIGQKTITIANATTKYEGIRNDKNFHNYRKQLINFVNGKATKPDSSEFKEQISSLKEIKATLQKTWIAHGDTDDKIKGMIKLLDADLALLAKGQ